MRGVLTTDRRICICGGAGFIGHHAALALVKDGYDVHVIDGYEVNNLLQHSLDFDNPLRNLYLSFLWERINLMREAGVNLHFVDLRNYHKTSEVMDRIRPSVVLHLAAISHAVKAGKDTFYTLDHSQRTLENVLDYCRGAKVSHFIYNSSSMAYGHFLKERVSENNPLEPLNIYGAVKVGGEKLIQAYGHEFGLPFTILRPSALYGPRCVSRRVVQAFIENAIAGKPLEIEGDGGGRLDFTYIQDLVQAYRLILTKENGVNQIFNIAYGGARSLNDLVNIVRSHFPDVEVIYKDANPIIPARDTLAIDRAKLLIGFSPQYPLERGVAEYVAWYKQGQRTFGANAGG